MTPPALHLDFLYPETINAFIIVFYTLGPFVIGLTLFVLLIKEGPVFIDFVIQFFIDCFSDKNLHQIALENLEKSHGGFTMNGIDTMSRADFKLFIEKLFCRLDHDKIKKIDVTPDASDQGCDLIIRYKNDVILGIHCTCIGKKVDTDAVQNIVKAKMAYKLTDLMIVTNNSFTKSAIDKAKIYKIKLVNREILLKMLQLYRKTKPNSKAVL